MTDIFIDKETWEPVISELLEDENVRHNVREVWSFDWQTHGESAILNEETLLRYEKPVGLSKSSPVSTSVADADPRT